MSKAQTGDTVKVHYTGKLDDGEVFDSSREREPLEFKIGEGKVIPGFEKEVIGMETGDTKTITVKSEEAYGPRRDDLIVDVPKSNFPESINPEVGQRLQMQQADGSTINVTVTELQEDKVKLDANHPLAGKDLTFEIELVNVG